MLTTYTSGARESERGYYAFGSDRRVVGTPATDHRFTGQKVDGTGLYYYNARYYDPVIGQFVSPDTIVPAPNQVFGYNRYMYVMGNPLRYNDPSGHCATTSNGKPDENKDAECWQLAQTIANTWDDYWQNRYGDVSVWNEHIAPSGVDATFMANELERYLNSETGQIRMTPVERVQPSPLDFGEYTNISVVVPGPKVNGARIGLLEFGVIVDDYGNVYRHSGTSIGTPGVSATRGDVSVQKGGGYVPIEDLNLSGNDEAKLVRDLIQGQSNAINGGTLILTASLAANRDGSAIYAEGGVSFPPSVVSGGGSSITTKYWFSWR